MWKRGNSAKMGEAQERWGSGNLSIYLASLLHHERESHERRKQHALACGERNEAGEREFGAGRGSWLWSGIA